MAEEKSDKPADDADKKDEKAAPASGKADAAESGPPRRSRSRAVEGRAEPAREASGAASSKPGGGGSSARAKRPSGKSAVSGGAAKPAGGNGGGGDGGTSAAPLATEMPVPMQQKLTQFVVTVDDTTGAIVKIERLGGEDASERVELSRDEYVAAYSHAYFAAPYYASYAASLYDPLTAPAAQAFLKYLSDYAKAVGMAVPAAGAAATATTRRNTT